MKALASESAQTGISTQAVEPVARVEPLPGERRRSILATIGRDGRAVSRELAREWGVSEDTIRRDIRELEEAGLVQRVHGGALPLSPQLTPYKVRADSNVSEKMRLGQRGAALIEHGMTALFYGGTTVLEVAKQLPRELRARIITNDPRVALEVSQRESIETMLIGGRVVSTSQLTVGSTAVDVVRGLRADICLIGACGLHEDFGLAISDSEEAALQRAFMEAANIVVALVTSDKLQTAAPFRVASAASIDRLICVGAADDVLNRFRYLEIAVENL